MSHKRNNRNLDLGSVGGLLLFYCCAMVGKFMFAIAWAIIALTVAGLMKLIEYVVYVVILKDPTDKETLDKESSI